MKRRRKQATWRHVDQVGKRQGWRGWLARLGEALGGSNNNGRNPRGGRPANSVSQPRSQQRHVAGDEPSKWRPLSAAEVLIWLAVALVAGAFLMLLGRQAWAAAAVALVVIVAFAWRELRHRG